MTEALSKVELSMMVEGWGAKGITVGQDLMSNVGAVAGGAMMARDMGKAAAVIGAALQVANGIAGPRHPWIQMITRPGVGMNDAMIGIKTYMWLKPTATPGE